MATKQQRAAEFRDWLQAVVIVVGLGVGIWQFQVKEIWNPASAPINITTEVSVKEAGFKGAGNDKGQQQFEAIELSVTAKNPSSRDVYLLKNCWFAAGATVIGREQNESWTDNVTRQIEADSVITEGAYYTLEKASLVEAGEVFTDKILHPNESISASFVFYMPQDVFDMLYVHVELPTSAVMDAVEFEWNVKPQSGCASHAYRKRKGTRAEEIKDFLAAFSDRTLQLQSAAATRELSLWQSKSR